MSSLRSARAMAAVAPAFALLLVVAGPPPASAQSGPVPSAPAAPQPSSAPRPFEAALDGGWPREVVTSAGTITVYQPQLVSTGNEVTAGRVSGTTGAGRSGTAGWARGEQGAVVRIGDDVYAGRDGSVDKRNPEGREQQARDGSWRGVSDRERTGMLELEQRARSGGARRVEGYERSRASGYGQGYRRAGGGVRAPARGARPR